MSEIPQPQLQAIVEAAMKCPSEYPCAGDWADAPNVREFSGACKEAGLHSLSAMALRGKGWAWYVRLANSSGPITTRDMIEIERRASAYKPLDIKQGGQLR